MENTGVKTDEKGYIKVNAFFETSKQNIWALGDAIDKKMFRHVANHEASFVWYSSVPGEKAEMDFM